MSKKAKATKFVTLRKMDMKTIEGRAISEIIKDGAEKEIWEMCQIIGIIRRLRPYTSKFGEGVAFRGEFCAKTPDGKLYRSPEFFAPTKSFQNELWDAWKAKGDAEELEFAINVDLQKDKDASAHGYAYIVSPLVQPGRSNALSSLAERAFGEALPQLETSRS